MKDSALMNRPDEPNESNIVDRINSGVGDQLEWLLT